MNNSIEYIELEKKNILPLQILKKTKICSKPKCINKCYIITFLNNRLNTIIDSLLIITIHIFFISIFEPLFYLNYVVNLEYNFIMTKIIEESELVYNKYITYPPDTRYFIDNTILDNKFKTLQDFKKRKDDVVSYKELQKDALYIQGIKYSSIIFGFILILFGFKYIRNNKINFCKIFLENIVMILFLFIYEYIFFNNFIMKYDTVDNAEINYYGLLHFLNYSSFHLT
jgi:hypothetical protein